MEKGDRLERELTITAPNLRIATFTLVGETPLVIHAFGEKSRKQMRDKMLAGSLANKGKKREPRDFDEDYKQSFHVAREGWYGINAEGFRKGMVAACRLPGFKMSLAKMCIFILADGYSKTDGTPLVKITKGEPHRVEHYARNDNMSVDLRVRPMWDEGWEAVLRVRYDADQFSETDVANLLLRMGLQGGIGEGRANSKESTGMGWGFFSLKGKTEAA